MAFRSSSAHAIAISRDGRDASSRGSNRRLLKLLVLQNLALDAVHVAVIAEFEQVPVVADEELEEPLTGFRLPCCRRLLSRGAGFEVALAQRRRARLLSSSSIGRLATEYPAMTMEDFTAADNDRWKAIVATLRSKDPILAEAIDELRQYAADETEVFEEINLIALMWFNAGNASAPHAEAPYAEAQLEMTHKRFTAADNDRWKAIVATVRAEDPVLAESTDELRQYAADAAEVVEGLADVLLKSFNARLQRERDERGDR